MAGYNRQSTYTDGDVINASDSNDEFDQLLAAFNNSSGHKHDGTAAEGPVIGLIGDPGVTTPINKVVVDDTNNRVGVFVDVSGSTTEQVRFQDGVIVPVTDNDIDLGTSSLEFKDLFLDGTATIDTLQVDESATITANLTVNGNTTLGNAASDTVTITADVASNVIPSADNTHDLGASGAEWKDLYIDGVAYVDSIAMPTTTVTDILDEDDMSSDSAAALVTQQSIKAYVDAQVTAQDLDFQADSGGALSIDLDSESLTFTGGTGVDTSGSGNAVTFAIDSTVATLAGSQTLTNKTIDVDNNTVSNIEVDNLKSGVLDTDLSSVSGSDDTLASAKAIKTYVDAQVTASDLDFQADSGGALSIDLDSETMTFTGGTGIDTTGSSNDVSFAIDSTVATLSGSQTLTNKTIDVDNNTVSNIEVDNFKGSAIVTESEGIGSSDNDTSLPTSAAVKDYVDTQITAEDLDITTDSGTIAIDLDSETLTVAGGTGIDSSATSNTVTLAIDSTVATLAGSQTFTNKTLTSAVLNGTISGTSIKDEDDMSSDSASHLATQQSIKAYIDSQVTAQDLDFQGDSGGALSIDLDSETLDIAGGTGIDTSGSSNTLTVAIDNTVTTLTGTQTLTNKTLTSPTINGGSLSSAVTATTQAAGTSNTTIATTAFAQTAASNEAVALAIALG
jgi:hypothetical protein